MRYRFTIRDTDHFDDEDGVFLLDDGAAREYAIFLLVWSVRMKKPPGV